MIDWNQEKITPPPLLNNKQDFEFKEYEKERLTLLEIPCHSQSVERFVDIVTKASTDRIGHASRHRFILNLLESRRTMPTFENKCQYNQ